MEQLPKPELVDLSDRSNAGLEVILWWVRGTMDTYVTVEDEKLGTFHHFPVPEGENANEVFYHPFAYKELTDGT